MVERKKSSAAAPDHDLAVELLAGSQGKDARELRGRNYVEDEMIAGLNALRADALQPES